MFSGADAPWHWVILAIVVIALFGYKRLPDAARSLGRSMRIFKTELKGMTEDDTARQAHQGAPPPDLVKPTPAADVVATTAPLASPAAPASQPTTPGTV